MIDAIPTVYHGTRFKSKMEADLASWLDVHAIPWVYEAEGFDLNGARYLPDFWLPKAHAFIEVKGIMRADDAAKIDSMAAACAPKEILVIIAEAPIGQAFSFAKPTPEFFWGCDDVVMMRCKACSQWTFIASMGGYKCVSCGTWDGCHHIKAWHYPDEICDLCRDWHPGTWDHSNHKVVWSARP